MEYIPEALEILALKSKLFALRDALVGVSQALRELQCMVDIEGQKQARDSVENILKKLMQA